MEIQEKKCESLSLSGSSPILIEYLLPSYFSKYFICSSYQHTMWIKVASDQNKVKCFSIKYSNSILQQTRQNTMRGVTSILSKISNCSKEENEKNKNKFAEDDT